MTSAFMNFEPAHSNDSQWSKEKKKAALSRVKDGVIELRNKLKKLRDSGRTLKAVKKDGDKLMYAPLSLRKDPEIVLEAVRNDGFAFQYAHPSLSNDETIVLEAMKQNGLALSLVHDSKLLRNKRIVLEAVKNDGMALQFAHRSMAQDKQIVLEAVKNDPDALQFADHALKSDRDIVLAAVKHNGVALKYSDRSLKKDAEIVLEAVISNGISLKYADRSVLHNTEIILAAMKHDVGLFRYADDSLKRNKSFAKTALNFQRDLSHLGADELLDSIRTLPHVLLFAPDRFRLDRKFVLNAVTLNGNALFYATVWLRNDRTVVLAAVKQNGEVLHCVSDVLRCDEDIVLEAVKNNAAAFLFAGQSMDDDLSCVVQAVLDDGTALSRDAVNGALPEVLEYAASALNTNKEMMLKAVAQCGYVFRYAEELLKQDQQIVTKAVMCDESLFQYAHESLLEDKLFAIEMVKLNGHSLRYVHDSLKEDKEVVLEAVKQNGTSLQFAHESLQNDPEVVWAAVNKDGYALLYAHESFAEDKALVLQAQVSAYDVLLSMAHESLWTDIDLVWSSVVHHFGFDPDMTAWLSSLTVDLKLSSNDDLIKMIDIATERLLDDDYEMVLGWPDTAHSDEAGVTSSLREPPVDSPPLVQLPFVGHRQDDTPVTSFIRDWDDVAQILQRASFIERFHSHEQQLDELLSDRTKQCALIQRHRDMMDDPSIREYFITVQLCLEAVMIASKAIHSKWVAVGYINSADYVIDGVELSCDHVPLQVPGVAALTSVLRQVNKYSKKLAVNNMSSFCVHLDDWSQYVRQIALFASEFRRTNTQVGRHSMFDRVKQASLAMIDLLKASDFNTPMKKLAESDAQSLVQAIMTGKLKHHAPVVSLTINGPSSMHDIVQDSLVEMFTGTYIKRPFQTAPPSSPSSSPAPTPVSHITHSVSSVTITTTSVSSGSVLNETTKFMEELVSLRNELRHLKSKVYRDNQSDSYVDVGNQLFVSAASSVDPERHGGINYLKQHERQMVEVQKQMNVVVSDLECLKERARQWEGECSRGSYVTHSIDSSVNTVDYRKELLDPEWHDVADFT